MDILPILTTFSHTSTVRTTVKLSDSVGQIWWVSESILNARSLYEWD